MQIQPTNAVLYVKDNKQGTKELWGSDDLHKKGIKGVIEYIIISQVRLN